MAWKDLFKRKSEFVVTEADRLWVEESFGNLIKPFGYPNEPKDVDVSKAYFINCFDEDSFSPENMLEDLGVLLGVDTDQYSITLVKDIRDSDLDYSTEGRMFEATLVIGETNHIIHLANSVVGRPKRMIYLIAKELIAHMLMEVFVNFDEDEYLFTYIAAIWFGFGTIFAENLIDVGFERDGLQEQKWYNYSLMPPPVFGYALAYIDKLVDGPGYNLSGEVGDGYNQATVYLEGKEVSLYNADELKANRLSAQSYEAYEVKEFEESIVLSQSALLLTQDDFRKADLLLNIGYNHQMLERYEIAISYFEKVLELNENYAYAYDNSGFCYINLGQLDKGKSLVEKAMETGGNDDGYSFRNLALYYWKIGDRQKAEEYFTMAKEWGGLKVDLLDELYDEFKSES